MANLITFPEAFDNAAWIKASATISTDAIAAPDGTMTGERITDDSSTGTKQVGAIQVVNVAQTSTQFTFSVFAQKDQLNWVHFEFDGWTSPPNNTKAFFDLENNVVGTVDAGLDDAGIEVFDDWARIWAVLTSDTADTQGNFLIGPADSDGDRDVAADGTSSIYVWGAACTEGNEPEPYVSQAGITVTNSTPKIIRPVTRNVTRNVTKNLIDF